LTSSQGWNTLDYGNGIYVTRSSVASLLATSTDGIAWVQSANSSTRLRISTFGLSATDTTTSSAFTFVPSFFNGNLFIAQSLDGINYRDYSTGLWTGTYFVGGIGYGNNRFIVPKQNSTDVIVISAGFGSTTLQAESVTLPSSSDWGDVAYGNGIFLITSNGSTGGAISQDNGINWSLVTLPAFGNSSYFNTKVIYGGGRFFAVAGGSDVKIAAFSTDGQTWTTKNLPITGSWSAPIYYNGKYITFLNNGDKGAYINYI
jgi:hypothetical protein